MRISMERVSRRIEPGEQLPLGPVAGILRLAREAGLELGKGLVELLGRERGIP